jgi:hypothetical protein
MARRADPERILAAQRAGVRARLTGTGMTPETADRWLDAWVVEATGCGLPKDGRYWNTAWDWIAEERAADGRTPNPPIWCSGAPGTFVCH